MDREYPGQPIVAVGAVAFTADERVVLVKRGHEPLAGQWSLPGGVLELGETLQSGLEREIREETGLDVEVGPVIDVVDRIVPDDRGTTQYHYVVVDYLCQVRGGTLEAGSDVDEIALVDAAGVEKYGVTQAVRRIVERAWKMRRDGLAPCDSVSGPGVG